MLQRQLSQFNSRKLDRRQFKPRTFSLFGFALSYAANIVILMILYDLCLLLAQFSYIIISESELLYDWRFTVNQFNLAPSPLRPTTRVFFNLTLAFIVSM
jgi:hypothetical protein